MWWWRKVRKANIPKDDRDIFERFGETVVGMILAGGYTPRAMELQAIYRDGIKQGYARDWLTERGDWRERREDRLETAEWAVLIFVIVGVAVDGLLFLR